MGCGVVAGPRGWEPRAVQCADGRRLGNIAPFRSNPFCAIIESHLPRVSECTDFAESSSLRFAFPVFAYTPNLPSPDWGLPASLIFTSPTQCAPFTATSTRRPILRPLKCRRTRFLMDPSFTSETKSSHNRSALWLRSRTASIKRFSSHPQCRRPVSEYQTG